MYYYVVLLLVILKMIVEEGVAIEAISNSHIIEEDEVEVRPERLPTAILDENLDIHCVRKYFTPDAWMAVSTTVQMLKDNPTYVCAVCCHDLSEADSIACDHCLKWYHLKCVGLRHTPKVKTWFCRKCHE